MIPLIINNESVVTETIFDVHNPATGEVIDRCASASIDDVNRAVAAAKAAFPAWSKTKPYDRRDILMRAADIMLSRREELIRYQMEETGAGRMFVEKTFELGAGFIKDFAARIPSIEGSVPSVSEEGECAMVLKEPYGVVLGIAPWYEPPTVDAKHRSAQTWVVRTNHPRLGMLPIYLGPALSLFHLLQAIQQF